MLRIVQISFLSFITLILVSFVQPSKDINLRVKAVYVYKFAQFVDWPKSFKSGDFIIGVFGDEKLYNEMQTSYANKMIGNQTIKIKKYDAVSEIEKCHILFVAEKNSDKVSDLVKKFKSNSTLIVSEKEGKMKDGAIFNFIWRDNKLKYEMSKTNATKHKLTVGQTLTNSADKIE